MRKNQYYHYFVEGEDEKKLVNVLKTDMGLVCPGKVEIFNVTQERLTKLRIMNLKQGTKVVLIFDTDAGNPEILNQNLSFLHRQGIISEVICVTQVHNLEDELMRSCAVKQPKELLGSRTNSDFKRDLILEKHLARKLRDAGFEMKYFWSSQDQDIYKEIKNAGYKIKR